MNPAPRRSSTEHSPTAQSTSDPGTFGRRDHLGHHSMGYATMPTPEDPGGAPVRENYVVAQAVQASLRSIPVHAVAVVARGLVGTDVHVEREYEIRQAPLISPFDGVNWIYAARD